MENRLQASPPARQLYLDAARVLAIISITLNHAVSRSFNIYNAQMAEFLDHSMLFSLGKAFLYIFSRLGVPLFLMISGALLLNKPMENANDIKRFYRHNLLNLFITAEIWYVIMYWCLVLFDPSNTVLETGGIGKAFTGMLKTMLFIDQTTMASMWYMPMILCLYTTIPMVTMVKNKLSSYPLFLFLPVILVYLNSMVLLTVNEFLSLQGLMPLSGAVSSAHLLSPYYIYVIIGYFISQGKLEKIRSWLVAAMAVLVFALTCIYQIYAFSKPADYALSYEFPLLPICAGLVFELLRRKAHWFRPLGKPITYLAKIAFGIYFVHILIMTALVGYMDFSGWHPFWKAAFLEVTSFAGSLLLIAVLSRIPTLRRHMFLIKD